MRIGCSKLNSDLCNNLHVIDSPQCQCGEPFETTYHYFMECQRYTDQRNTLIDTVQTITDVSLMTLLYGNDSITLEENIRVFDAVHKFIIDTKRF